jgi:DNA polymerase-4
VRVGLKIRFAPFITVTRSLTLPAPTNDPRELSDAAVSLLDRLEPQQRARQVRLLGVRLEMTPSVKH